MNKTEIKKELYKQKPTADLNRTFHDAKEYTCQLLINNSYEVVFFHIPLRECDFAEVVPAQLLIRWMI